MNVTHEINREKTTTTWLTPKAIIDALGHFDLDPCTPPSMPWATAASRYTEQDDGLLMPWYGRVWLNPPYGKGVESWLNKMALHGNGIALLFARTDTKWFHDHVLPNATAVLFKKGKINFCNEQGEASKNGAGMGSILIAYGPINADILKNCKLPGLFVNLKLSQVERKTLRPPLGLS